MDNNLNILLLGDYSNCHATLAEGLRKHGHNVVVASNGGRWMQTECDLKLKRKEGKLGGLLHYVDVKYLKHKDLKGYDIVAVNDPHFVSLKPSRLKELFDRLRRENGRIFYTAMSTDIYYLKMLEDENSPLRYSEWFVDHKPSKWYLENTAQWNEWHAPDLQNYQKHFFERIDGAVAVLYEYYKGLEYALPKDRIGYGGIPVNTSVMTYEQRDISNRIKILLCRDSARATMKGSEVLLKAAERIKQQYPDKVDLSIAEHLPFNSFIKVVQQSDIVLDQIYSYTPATTALLSMAMGKTVLSGGEKEFYDFIGEKENTPIINAQLNDEDIFKDIEALINNPEIIKEKGSDSRKFVLKHNSDDVVAERFIRFWCNFI